MDIDDIVAKIKALLEKVRSKVEALASRINSLLSHVPRLLSWVIDKVQELWNKLVAKLSEFWDWFTDKLAYAGNPALLHDTGQRWNTDLGLPTHQRAEDVDSDDLLVDDTWTGTAAEAYKNKIGDQQLALDAVGQSMAATVASALNSVKSGIWAFWAGVVLAVIALVGGIIGAVTASGTIVGIPVGVAAAILAVVGFLGAAGAGVLVLVNQCSDAADSLRTAQAYVDPWPTFT